MAPRIDPFGTEFGPRFAKYLIAADKAMTGSPLPPATRGLVQIRAS